ncbi:MAG: nitroreductase family protein [Bacteroidales bacterium]|jgi:predicted oxidoreductase (fatty acid repression mutant protein)|nr:nitroreductase family protein [Bacteroidales bacterium]
MNKTLEDFFVNRRTIYTISPKSNITDKQIEEILTLALKNVPSAFNSQTARLVLLLNDNHKKLWEITLNALKKIVSPEQFPQTENKIKGFASGYGTILFFEDMNVIEKLQKDFVTYANNFPSWSIQGNAMQQFAVWSLLSNEGFGVSLQHYNELIEEDVKSNWQLPGAWKMIAQMPFGVAIQPAGEKQINPIEDRLKIFK